MGNCCSSPQSRSEEFLLAVYHNLLLIKMNYDQLKAILYKNDSEVEKMIQEGKLHKTLSDKSLSALEISLSKISKDNFKKLASNHFYRSKESENKLLDYHVILFSNLFQKESLQKEDILFYFLPLLNDSKLTKSQYFINSLTSFSKNNQVQFDKFKEKLNKFFEFSLITFQKVFIQDDDNKVDDEIKDEIRTALKDIYNEEHVQDFIQRKLSLWEEQNNHSPEDFSTLQPSLQGNFISIEEIETILQKYDYIFDFWSLKKMFLRNYKIIQSEKIDNQDKHEKNTSLII